MLWTLIQDREIVGVIVGVSFGIIARILMLRTDYRQYPTYPHGKIIHVSLGIIAAGLGAVAVPALVNKDYTAVTFLALAAQQFRDVRNMERESLTKADELELVPRGASFIEGIAMVFEGRNYLVIFCSFMAALFSILFQWYWGIAAGFVSLIITYILKSGKNLVKIVDVRISDVRLEGPDLYVDSVYIMNVGLEENREIIRKHGLGLLVIPKNKNAKVTIANLRQRQAILHNLSTILGVYRDSGEPSLLPMAKLDLESGNLALFLLPRNSDPNQAVNVLNHVPVLENAIRLPSEAATYSGKEA